MRARWRRGRPVAERGPARTALLILALLVPASVGWAETSYLRDEVRVSLRAQPDAAAAVLRVVRSGQALETLERGEEWVHVRIPDGVDGWLPAQYIVAQPPPSVRLPIVLGEVEQLRAEVDALRAATAASLDPSEVETIVALRARVTALEQSNAELSRRAGTRAPAAAGGGDPDPAIGAEIDAERSEASAAVAPASTSVPTRGAAASAGDPARLAPGADYAIGAAILLAGMVVGGLWPRRPSRGGLGSQRRIKL